MNNNLKNLAIERIINDLKSLSDLLEIGAEIAEVQVYNFEKRAVKSKSKISEQNFLSRMESYKVLKNDAVDIINFINRIFLPSLESKGSPRRIVEFLQQIQNEQFGKIDLKKEAQNDFKGLLIESFLRTKEKIIEHTDLVELICYYGTFKVSEKGEQNSISSAICYAKQAGYLIDENKDKKYQLNYEHKTVKRYISNNKIETNAKIKQKNPPLILKKILKNEERN